MLSWPRHQCNAWILNHNPASAHANSLSFLKAIVCAKFAALSNFCNIGSRVGNAVPSDVTCAIAKTPGPAGCTAVVPVTRSQKTQAGPNALESAERRQRHDYSSNGWRKSGCGRKVGPGRVNMLAVHGQQGMDEQTVTVQSLSSASQRRSVKAGPA